MPETKVGLDQLDVPAPLWYRKMTNALILCFIPVYTGFINIIPMTDYTRSLCAQIALALPVLLKGFAMVIGNGQHYSPSNKTIENMKMILLIATTALFLQSCYTPNKARNQVNKAYEKHPAVVAELTRVKFPCITKSMDSTDYYRQQRENDSLFLLFDSALNARAHENELLAERLRGINIDSISSEDCSDLLKQSISYSTNLEKQNNELKSLNIKLRNVKPGVVKESVEDSAKTFLAQRLQRQAEDSANHYRTLYKKEKEELDAIKSIHKGKLDIRIPWWLIILLAVSSLGFIFRNSIKSIFMRSVFFVFAILAMTGCKDFHDEPGTSVFSGWLWTVPVLIFGGALASFITSLYKGKKENKKFYKTGWFAWTIGLLIIGALVMIGINASA